MIAANDVSNPNLGFNSDENALIVLTSEKEFKLELESKHLLAKKLMALVANELECFSNE